MKASNSPVPLGMRVVGRYEILEHLGMGGVGAVYRARELASGREVALKMLRNESALDRDAVLRLKQEFHVLAQLRHPRIVEVFEFGTTPDGSSYYTMELLDGEDLQSRGQMPAREACRVLRDVASALSLLHARRLIHRDLSPRNVRLTSDLRAKLFDFGALATFGHADRIVGTPPLVPPEALQGLPLDSRTDLYSLGALAYWLLTNRHAYPAREFSELPSLWGLSIPPPSAIAPDLPPGLDELILLLLSREPLARPSSAAEVIDRLGAAAGLDPLEGKEEPQAYLQSTAFVGRGRLIDGMRYRIRRTMERQRGSSIVVRGGPGTGKTRLLRELALEAQTAGTAVLRGEPEGDLGKPYALGRQLVQRLLEVHPEIAVEALWAHAPVLGRVLPEVRAACPNVTLAPPVEDLREEHARIQSHFAEWIVAVASSVPLSILVDGLEACDEGSVSVLVSLAHMARKAPIFITTAVRTGDAIHAATAAAALESASTIETIGDLSVDGVRDLVRSLFADARGTDQLSEALFDSAGGNPLLTVELARLLVERAQVQHVDGLWMVPDRLDLSELPRGIAAAMSQRVANLSEDIRELATFFAVHGGPLSLGLCARLGEPKSEEEVFAALEALTSADVVMTSGRGYRFRDRWVREALLEKLDPSVRARLHLRVARAIEATAMDEDGEVALGWHYLHGGDHARAAEFLERGGMRLCEAHAFREAVEPLDAALRLRTEQGSAKEALAELQYSTLASAFMSDRALFIEHLPRASELLAEVTGIRLASRLERIIGRHLAFILAVGYVGLKGFGGGGRKLPLGKALQLYAMTALMRVGLGVAEWDVRVVAEAVDALRPLALFRRTLPYVAFKTAELIGDVLSGDHSKIRAKSRELGDALRVARVDAFNATFIQGAVETALGTHYAEDGNPLCFEQAERLEALGSKVWQVVALQVRIMGHLVRGEFDLARRIQREHEALAYQLGSTWQHDPWRLAVEAMGYGMLGDPIGLKRSIQELQRAVRDQGVVNLEGNLRYAEGEYHRVRGEFQEGRRKLEEAMELHRPGEAVNWDVAVSAYVELLTEAGHHEDAEQCARRAIERSEAHGRLHTVLRLGRALALSEAALDRLDEATSRLDTLIDRASVASNPAAMGLLYEARAVLAQRAGSREDHDLFLREAELCFRSTMNPLLIGRLERMKRNTRGTDAILEINDPFLTKIREIRARFASCVDTIERAQLALQIVMEATGANAGSLCVQRRSEEQLIRVHEGDEPDSDALEALERVLYRLPDEEETSMTMTEMVTCSLVKTSGDWQAWPLSVPTDSCRAALALRTDGLMQAPFPGLLGLITEEVCCGTESRSASDATRALKRPGNRAPVN